jgi:hypothetical protein
MLIVCGQLFLTGNGIEKYSAEPMISVSVITFSLNPDGLVLAGKLFRLAIILIASSLVIE